MRGRQDKPDDNQNKIIENLSEFAMLIMIINSGFDIELEDWRKIVEAACCPIWLDIHSLPLAKRLNTPRMYLPLPDWKDWASGDCLPFQWRGSPGLFSGSAKLPASLEIRKSLRE